MARYKQINTSPQFIAADMEQQMLPVAAIVDLETLKAMQQGAASDRAALAASIQDTFKDMPAGELDALVDEAMGALRPAYRPAQAGIGSAKT